MSFELPPPRRGSLRFSIEAKYGPDILRVGVFKSAGVVENDKRLNDLLRSYLNDFKKPDHKQPPEHEKTLPNYSDLVVLGNARQRPGIDYIAGENGISVSGYLADLLSQNVSNIEALSEPEKMKVVRRLWTKKRAKYKKKGHHLIFSVNPRISSALGELGISIDIIISAAISDAMTSFGNRFYREFGLLGWVTGIHHDKHHVHAHTVVFPTTSEGKGLNLCNRARVNLDGKAIRVNFLDVIGQSYFSSVERHCRLGLGPMMNKNCSSLGKVIEFGGLVDACLFVLRHASNDVSPSLADAVSQLPAFVKTPDALARVNEAIRRRHPKPNTANVAWFIDRVKRYKSNIQRCKSELDGDVLQLASTKARLARLFQESQNSPDGYHGIKYTPNTPLQSPSSTLSFLSTSTTNNHWDEPAWYHPTRSETQSILADKMARHKAVLARLDQEFPFDATLKPGHANDVYNRVGLVVAMMSEVYGLYMGMKSGTSIYSNAPEVKSLVWKSPKDSWDGMLEAARKGARVLAHEQRSATCDELRQDHELREICRTLKATEIEAEPEELILPATPLVLPAGSNFLEREAGRAGLRSISQMREQTEALFKKICQDLSWNPADSSPYWVE